MVAPDRGAGPQVLGVPVAGDHLGGRGRGQAEGAADVVLHPGIDVGVGADRPGQLAHRHPVPGGPQALEIAVGLQRPQRELGPEGGRLGVHAVGPAGDRDVDQLDGAGREGPDQPGTGLDEQVGGPGEGGAQGGVHHVGGGEAVVDPRSLGLADGLLDHVDEGGDVVVGDPLPLGHRLDEGGVDLGRPVPAGLGGLGRHVAHLGPALGGQQLDPEPHGEPGLVGEEGRHRRRCVATDHRDASAVSEPTRPCRWPMAAPVPPPGPEPVPAPAPDPPGRSPGDVGAGVGPRPRDGRHAPVGPGPGLGERCRRGRSPPAPGPRP